MIVARKRSSLRLSQRNFIHHKLCMDWRGVESRPQRLEAGDEPPESASLCLVLYVCINVCNLQV
jgi:hypothetical protein